MKKREKSKKQSMIHIIIVTSAVIFFIIAIIALFAIIELPYLLISNNSSVKYNKDLPLTNNTVTKVTDGDTFTLYSGEKVRLLCINAPEIGKKNYTDAKNFLKEMILGKEVILEKGNDNKDKYNRLLRYVYINMSGAIVFVNSEIYKNGYAKIYNYGNETSCEEKLK